MSLSVSVVIVTYNAWPHLRRCLASIGEQERPADEVIVVDNGSDDETPALIEREFPDVVLVRAGGNLGFAAGNNLGIARSRGDLVVLVNNDVVAEPGFLAALTEPFKREPTLGSVASTMVFARDPDTVASAGIELYQNGLALDRAIGARRGTLRDGTPVFGPSAGAAAYRRAALDDVGAFPESFFMYLEDVDLAWRLRLRGWECVHAASAVVRHAYSASAVEGSSWKRRLLARNRVWVLARCMPWPVIRGNWYRIAGYELMATSYAITHGDAAALRGRLDGIRQLRPRLRERRRIQRCARTTAVDLARWLKRPPRPGEMLRLRELTRRLAE